MQQIRTLIAVLLPHSSCSFTGCASPVLDGSGEDSATSEADVTDDGTTSGVGEEDSVEGEGLADSEPAPLDTRTIYFDFDESIVSEEGQVIIQAHAEVLASNPDATMIVAGHADERGTREYNLALGDQRAEAVSRYFQEFGVDVSRIKVISYGEEQPASMESNEEAWRLNRRAEFDY